MRRICRTQLFPFFAYLCLFSALFNPRIPILWSISIGLILLSLIVAKKINWQVIKAQPFILGLLAYWFYYLLSAFLWSKNLTQSIHSLPIQISLFLIPLLFVWLAPSWIELAILRRIWVRVILAVTLIELFYSAWRYFHSGDYNLFFTDQLTALTRTHTTYFSMYLLVTFVIILQEKLPFKNLKSTLTTIGILLFISFIAYLLGSKIVLFCFLLAWGFFAYRLLKLLKPQTAFGILGFCTLALILWVSLFKVNLNRYRGISDWQPKNYADMRNELDQREEYDASRWTTISFRVALWQSGWQVLKENPWFGVGIGDMQDSMMEEYRARNFQKALLDKSKLHNTFLDIGVESGLIGIILFLLAIFILPLRANWNKANFGNILLLISLFLSMQFESYTARTHYEIFLALILCLIAYNPNSAQPK